MARITFDFDPPRSYKEANPDKSYKLEVWGKRCDAFKSKLDLKSVTRVLLITRISTTIMVEDKRRRIGNEICEEFDSINQAIQSLKIFPSGTINPYAYLFFNGEKAKEIRESEDKCFFYDDEPLPNLMQSQMVEEIEESEVEVEVDGVEVVERMIEQSDAEEPVQSSIHHSMKRSEVVEVDDDEETSQIEPPEAEIRNEAERESSKLMKRLIILERLKSYLTAEEIAEKRKEIYGEI